jgi:MYXO-CTERM domain-containing protein
MRPIALASAAVVAFVPGAVARASGPDAPDLPRIYQGTPVETCGWPTTVAVQGGGGLCTGTLVHPRVVVYAAHCGGGGKTVRFSENLTVGQTLQSQCVSNPGYNNNQGTDWAYCVLPEPVDIPVTPVAYGCEKDILQVGQPVVIVGFGQNMQDVGAGTKRWKDSNIGGINWGSNIVQMVGYCQGDSGGPAFVRYPDPFGTWHAFSIVSTGICGGAGTHSLMPGAVPWIEEDSGIDITPCFDDAGEWDPNPMCAGFFAGSEVGHGTWSDWCEGTPAGGSHATCGDAFDAVPDETPPAVTITAPATGSVYDQVPAPVDLIMAVDDVGWGVRSVWVEINGQAQPAIEAPPWEFLAVPFPMGGYTVYAYAEDWAGNVGVSPPVTFGVGQDAPEPPPDETGDTGAESTGGTGDETGPAGSGDEGGGGGGCGCAMTNAPPSAAAFAGLVLAAIRRRRAGETRSSTPGRRRA